MPLPESVFWPTPARPLEFSQIHENKGKTLCVFLKIFLTKRGKRDIILGHAWDNYVCNAMMQEIAPDGGNFCGVCPVIGRLNCFNALAYIAGRMENGSASVGHFSWPGMIRTAARTK